MDVLRSLFNFGWRPFYNPDYIDNSYSRPGHLVNGDIINGQLEEQTGEHLIWNSDSLGTLTIALEQVALIDGQPFGEKPTEIFSNTYHGSLSFTGAYASGNQEREDWDFDRVEWRQGDFRHHSNLNYETHSLNDSPANREYALGYGVDWFFQEQWFWKNAFLLRRQ